MLLIMNKIKRSLLFWLILAACVSTYGQQVITISGMVRDEAYNAVPFHEVFMSASDSLLTRTFVTDEGGFFRDSLYSTGTLINYLYFYTFDFQGGMKDTLVTDLNQMIFIEFIISNDTIPVGCSANFLYMLDSLSTEPNLYQFFDMSSGNIDSWSWDFGDSTFSTDQNPQHQFTDSGVYNVCLTVSGPGNPVQCSDTHCEQLSTPDYFSAGGLVWAGDYPLNNPVNQNDTGVVHLYRLFQGQFWYVTGKEFHENGYYWFTDLLEGEYMVKVGLTASSGSYHEYFPTYFGDKVDWSAGLVINLDEDQFENHIHLTPVAELPSGQGIINGYVTCEGFDPSGIGESVTVILSESTGQPLKFTHPDAGGFYEFNGLPYGDYTVTADLAGRYSTFQAVSLTPSSPFISLVEITVNEMAYFGIDEPEAPAIVIGHPFPNPANDHVTFKLQSQNNGKIDYTVTDITGRKWLSAKQPVSKGDNVLTIDVSALAPGIYLIYFQAVDTGRIPAGKFIK